MNLNKTLAEEVQRVLRERRWTLRAASEASGLPHTTIFHMSQGRSVRLSNVKKWAEAIGESPYRWAEIALKPHLDQDREHEEKSVPLSEAAAEVARLFESLPPHDKNTVKSLLEVLMKNKI